MFGRRLFLLLLLGALLAIAGGCRRQLRAPVNVDPAVLEIREQYAAMNPDDPFLDAIAEQKLRKGMSPTQVYLAWGRPVHRFKGEGQQKWIYEFSEDPNTQPKTITHLFFEKEKLVRWKVNRGYVYFLDPESAGDSADDLRDLPGLGSSKQP